MSFDNFDFSSLAPNSKRNQIYSCLGFSMGFLLKKTFNTYDIFISNFFNNFLVSHNLLTPLRPYPTVLGGLPPKKLGVHVHPVHPQWYYPCNMCKNAEIFKIFAEKDMGHKKPAIGTY